MGSGNQQDIQDKVNQTIKQAQQAIASGDQHNAVLLLDQVLSQHPDHPEANYQSALIDLEINGSEVALKKFEKAVTNKPQSESHWIGYIETLMESASLEIVLEALELGQQYALTSKKAQDLASKFLSKQSQNPNDLLNSGVADDSQHNDQVDPSAQQPQFSYKDVGDQNSRLVNEANQAIEQAKSSSSTSTHNDLPANQESNELQTILEQAITAHQNDDYDQAIEGYLAVLKLDEKHAEANHNLGVIIANTSSALNALSNFETSIQTDPSNEQYWVSYIDALIMCNELEKAMKVIDLGSENGLSNEYASLLKGEISQLNSKTTPDDPTSNDANVNSNHFSKPKQLFVLIPAYKHSFMIPVLMGLRSQTYNNFKVVISDDSPEDEITRILKTDDFSNTLDKLDIEIIQGPKQGPMSNIIHLIKHIKGQSGFAHFLLDDDLIYPSFYEEHMKAHSFSDVGASINYRWFINEAGQPLARTHVPDFVKNNPNQLQALSSQELFESTVPTCDNWLGEFSNAVFAIEQLSKFEKSSLIDLPYYGLGDIGFYLDISLSANVILVKNYLSGFRAHTQQNSFNITSKTFKAGLLSWVSIALDSYELGNVSIDQLNQNRNYTYLTLSRSYSEEPDMKEFIALLANTVTSSNTHGFKKQFSELWNNFLSTCNDWVQAEKIVESKAATHT